MSLSEAPPVVINYDTARDISNEVLGGTLKFCEETGYKLNLATLTFFWTAFLFAARKDIVKNGIIDDVLDYHSISLCYVYPKLREDDEMAERVTKMRQRYWDDLNKNFSTLQGEQEIASLLEIANKLNNNGDEESLLPSCEQSQSSFSKIASLIDSHIYGILHRIDNKFTIQFDHLIDKYHYANTPQELSSHPSASENQNTVTSKQESKNTKPIRMAWYKFLIYFALIAGPIINVFYGISYLSGGIYFVQSNGQMAAEDIYAYYGAALQTADILLGICMIGFAILQLVLRHKLANFKSDAIEFVCITYSAMTVIPLVYAIFIVAITGESISGDVISSFLSGLFLLIFNIKYFKNRAHLFVDESESELDDMQNDDIATSESEETKTTYHHGDDSECDTTDMASEWERTEKTIPAQKIRYCSRCGHKINPETKRCTGCGKQYFKGINWKTIIISLIILALAGGCVTLFLALQDANSTIEKLENKISTQQKKIDRYEQSLNDWLQQAL